MEARLKTYDPPAAGRAPALDARRIFEILVRENADMLTSYLRGLLRTTEAVDDIFQETMLLAWRRLGDFDRSRPFGPWLRGIATNLVLKHRDRDARDVILCEPEVIAHLKARHDEAEAGGRGDVFEKLEECLERLPDRLRSAIRLVYDQGLAVREAARRLGASADATKKRVQRGRRLLADCLRTGEARS